jgi:5-methylcytosine-specific restriction protein B
MAAATMRGRIYLGQVTGPAYFADSADGRSNLRRLVAWYESQRLIEAAQLETPAPALLPSQACVIDLTDAHGQLAGLVPNENQIAVVPAATVTSAREEASYSD